jgi:hypothetical protein
MDRAQVIGAIVLTGLVLFQFFVTFRVWRSPLYDRSHKLAQSKLIWLLPALGAVLVFSVLMDEERAERETRKPPTQLRS